MEEQNNNSDAFNEIKKDLSDYLNLKIESYKLRGVETLSSLFSKAFFVILMIVLSGVALQLFAFAAGYLLGECLSSNAAGFAIIGGLLVIVLAVLYLCRNKLFLNFFIKTFVKVFFNDNDSDKNE